MRRRVGLALAVALGATGVSCGSRTALLPGGPGGAGGSSSGSGGGGPTPLAVKCHAALQDGAPTPTRGFCPTRANQAALAGPHAPAIAWSVAPFPIQSPEDYLPAETVVDATGRVYVAIDSSPQAATGTPNQLFAVNADGSVAWTMAFDATSAIGQLSLDEGGRLWLVEASSQTGPCMTPSCTDGLTALTALSRDGAPVASLMPAITPFTQMAIASDGSFFVGSYGLARVAGDGSVLWSNDYSQLGASIVVGPSDDVVTDGLIFDGAGTELPGGISGDLVAVDAAGRVVALSVVDSPAVSLDTFDPGTGAYVNLTLPSPTFTIDAYQLAVAGDGTTLVLLADEATAPGLTKSELQILAVDPSGKVRWTTPLDVTLPYDPADLTTHYGLFVDGAGTVVVTAGTVMGLDLASGSLLWTLAPPHSTSCLRPAVLGAGGAIVATQCDGTVFLARDP